ncbi:MAG: hypothetical protein ACNA8P_13085, partial [Phycisphaerales bacterium]
MYYHRNAFLILVVLGAASVTCGAQAAPESEVVMQEGDDQSFLGRIGFSASLHFTNKYYFRGIIQEDRGFIAQPGAELSLLLHESEEWSLSSYVGIWNSFHDRKTGAADGVSNASWYEIDTYVGLSL